MDTNTSCSTFIAHNMFERVLKTDTSNTYGTFEGFSYSPEIQHQKLRMAFVVEKSSFK